ncbi:hypothetical protein RSSM_00776 [Rhodopirellula sallentina SM41]|uniref:Uncharacterized protein n=1 Tax=Rhodopirellula sallentina SM41 TaxID=1263870 RepID=M5U8L8_9BACT|nr:hypothetical protein RSSM_00776 [Rhodopirellula sallentina SM41]
MRPPRFRTDIALRFRIVAASPFADTDVGAYADQATVWIQPWGGIIRGSKSHPWFPINGGAEKSGHSG